MISVFVFANWIIYMDEIVPKNLNFDYIVYMGNKSKKISVLEYTDYRHFLKAYYTEKKKSNRHFSFRGFAQKAGVAPSLYKDLYDGRRNLSISVMKKYADAMKMTAREKTYFEMLVRFTHGKTNREKNECFAEMVRLRVQAGIYFVGLEHYEFFTKWHNIAIRELVSLPTFVEDPKIIAKQLSPSITPREVEQSIKLMLKTGILKRDINGRLIQSNGIISSEYEMASSAIRSFHSQMIDLAGRSLEEVSIDRREVSSLTVGITYQMEKRIKNRIRIFKEEILAMIADDKEDSETICQINFQQFPLMEPVGAIDDKGDENEI